MKETTDKLNAAIAQRLRDYRLKFELRQDQAADKFGIAFSTYKRYESGKNGPDSDALAGMMHAGLNANWLLTGEGEMLLADMVKRRPIDWGIRPESYEVREPAKAPYGFVLVPRYDVAASMGNGAVIHSEQVVDHLAFRDEWVRTELGTNPKNLVLITAIGDSMEPTLRAGDLLLIDRSSAEVRHDAIYAFATNGELRVKRMQLKIDGSLVVKSDNNQYEAELLTADQASTLRIVGRVVWSGRRM